VGVTCFEESFDGKQHTVGLLATGTWPLNDHVVDNMLAPSLSFDIPVHETSECSTNSEGA
jgi:hypothetical protein